MKKTGTLITTTLMFLALTAGAAMAQPGTVKEVSGDQVTVQLEEGIGSRFEAGIKIQLDNKSGEVSQVAGDVVTLDINRGKAAEFSVGQAIDLRKKPTPGGQALQGC